jgi:Ca2+-binding EF-hand superfamily protein
MKKTTIAIALLALTVQAGNLAAQERGERPERPEGRPGQTERPRGEGPRAGQDRPAPMPFVLFDKNRDGVIDANEIADAKAALLTLDKNGDGRLTPDEVQPQRPQQPLQEGQRQGRGGNREERPPQATERAEREGERPSRPEGRPGQPAGERPAMNPLFDMFDTNNDGVIGPRELNNASRALAALDNDGDGSISHEEFRAYRAERMGQRRGEARQGSDEDRPTRSEDRPRGPRQSRD